MAGVLGHLCLSYGFHIKDTVNDPMGRFQRKGLLLKALGDEGAFGSPSIPKEGLGHSENTVPGGSWREP